jgi:hypothetical protein
MFSLEPHYNWRKIYTAEEDVNSPFYGRVYSEFEFTNAIYDTVIHPQWDEFGSLTLYTKILFANYDLGFVIMEFLGEWNDLIYNDIMYLYRNVIEELIEKGIQKFILIGENVHAFHADDDSYYEEWVDQLEDGWIVGLQFLDHNMDEIQNARIDYYISFENNLELDNWRTYDPNKLFAHIDQVMKYRLGE